MTRLFLAAGVAALAIAAPAASDPGAKGGKAQAAKVERGGGKAQVRAQARGSAKAEVRSQRRSDVRLAMDDRRPARSEARAEKRRDRAVSRIDRREVRAANRGESRELRTANRIDKAGIKALNRIDKADIKALNRIDKRSIKAANKVVRDRSIIIDDDGYWSNPGIGCPPGLAKQNDWCMPPGLLKNSVLGQGLPLAYRDRLLPLGLRDLYRDDDDYYYRLGQGYVYRVDRETQLVSALLPLLGAGLGLGQMFPTSFMGSYVPNAYRPFYPDSQDDYYRFANGYVYEIDRDTGMIEDMIPLMANGYGVGQMLPLGYSAYNLPYQYRPYYQDSADAYYRYAPGAIYRVDPTTQLITAVASLLAPGSFGVGQRLPMGYSTYNVPLAYRDQYYDTPDSWYRYNNGSIYQVDPTTQLITAVIRALV